MAIYRDIKSTAARLSRLSPKPVPASVLEPILRKIPDAEFLRLCQSSDEEIYRLFDGQYPTSSFHQMFVGNEDDCCDEEDGSQISEELRRILAIMDKECVLVNNVDLLGALDVVMTKGSREFIRGLPEEVLDVVCDGLQKGNAEVSGILYGMEVTLSIPPAMDTYLELVFSHLEELG